VDWRTRLVAAVAIAISAFSFMMATSAWQDAAEAKRETAITLKRVKNAEGSMQTSHDILQQQIQMLWHLKSLDSHHTPRPRMAERCTSF
jgi:hypothetical protein